MRPIAKLTVAAAMVLTVAACGQSQGDRALSGAGLGAAGGAAIGALSGTSVLGAAAVGGAAGAVAGAATRPDQVNLGRPAWR